MMDKWNLIVDVERCENCGNCVIATKDEYCDNRFPGYAAPQPRHGHEWIRISRRVRGAAPMVDAAYLITTCNQCANAPCVKAAPDAVYQRDDGIVIIDPEKAKGRREIVDSCPYGAIWWNEDEQLPQKWIFDAHLLDMGRQPRAVQACPTGALHALKASDEAMAETAAREGLRVPRPELGTAPRVYYRNLHRYEKWFLGGTVVAHVNGVEECVAAALVEIFCGGVRVASAESDEFGDFKFDGLDPVSKSYSIKVSHPVFGEAVLDAVLEDSRYVGLVSLG